MLTEDDRLILRLIAADDRHVAARTALQLGVTRQAASSRLARLRKQGLVASTGRGVSTRYTLTTLVERHQSYPRAGLQEHLVWREFFLSMLRDLPANVLGMWEYTITEMVNNAVEHSGAETVLVGLRRNALRAESYVSDDGEGIFLKIQRALNLIDPHESILELAKGKLTTDPDNHTGEGIFFSSKAMEMFDIRSGRLHFVHDDGCEDWLLERPADAPGTLVMMGLTHDNPCTIKSVFDQFTAPEEYSFAKTMVPVRLAQYEGESLVSRSQAKRLTMRFEKFQTVVLDFDGVAEIGQAFADEVFRVFQQTHPQTTLVAVNPTPAVDDMIQRARSGLRP
ncbi:protein of unknown function [Allochromatium warmingii]|uniref:DUF4325 domain-containing protein n=1 Tax=Allochromatium warmingii TaxID=61595 RepID=A0A1H3K4K1_ALLWA|nr:DUF4325 domain-containing protein [Allochromatium warmingii]SDY47091.1 protein of unknown function [Allochromatium warmingii]